jgi:hypothetical protein
MTRRDDGPLGGLVRRKVIRELALMAPGDSQAALAKKYGVSGAAMTKFKQRHAEEIAAVAADADNEFAGILIAQKAYRLRMLEEIVETAMTPQPKVAANGNIVTRYNSDGEPEEVMEVQLGEARQALRAAADELGQIPQRVQITGGMDNRTTYKIVNVSDEDLT